MNKKVLGVFISLLAVGMFALPMSSVLAKSPTTYTLTGFNETNGIMVEPIWRSIWAGESGNLMVKWRGLPFAFTGDITAGDNETWTGAYYNGNWLWKDAFVVFPSNIVSSGVYILEDAAVKLSETKTLYGDLRIGINRGQLIIESGTGDLKGIRGKGTAGGIDATHFTYEIDITITE